MVNGGVTVQGRHYRVIKDLFENFGVGAEVVALENDEVPYCVDVRNFNGSFNTDDYDDEDVRDMFADCELEEMEGNSSEIKD